PIYPSCSLSLRNLSRCTIPWHPIPIHSPDSHGGSKHQSYYPANYDDTSDSNHSVIWMDPRLCILLCTTPPTTNRRSRVLHGWISGRTSYLIFTQRRHLLLHRLRPLRRSNCRTHQGVQYTVQVMGSRAYVRHATPDRHLVEGRILQCCKEAKL